MTFFRAIARSFWTTVFVALVSSGCLGLLAIPAVGVQLDPLICEEGETMVYETYSYSTGSESGVNVEYYCDVNGDRREVGFFELLSRGALVYFGAIFVIVWPLSTIMRFRREQNRERLEREGIPATARILAVEQTNMRINDRPVLKLELEIQPEGYPPFTYNHRQAVPELALFQLQPGNVLSATVDPENHENLIIDLSNVKFGTGSSGRGGQSASVGRLRELKQMLDDGLISRHEYEEKKDEILNNL